MSKIIAVLDLGSNKIAAILARVDKNGSISLLAFENLYSRSVNGGDITDINKAVEEVSSIMGKLQRLQRRRIKNVHVTIKGADIKMDISRGMIPLAKTPREITKRDVERCLENVSLVRLPLDRAILDKFIRGFYIDGGRLSITSPIGLYGIKLEAETIVATANQSKIQNITKCIDHSGFLLDGIYLSSMASANSVLDEKEKEKGVLLLDIGDSLTEGLIFKNNMLNSFHTIKKGAKEKLDSLLEEARTVFQAFRSDFSSVVVSGDGSLIDGIIEETEKVFEIPARIGVVKNTGYNLNLQDAIVHTSTIGLVNHLAKEYKAAHTYKNPLHRAFHKVLDIYESYF